MDSQDWRELTTMQKKIVQLNGITKTFVNASTPIINDLTLTAHEGDIVGIHGVSGSGKTTLINIIAGLEKPSSGKVNLFDFEFSKLSTPVSNKEAAELRRTVIGVIPQNLGLIGYMSAHDNVLLALLLAGVSYRKAGERSKHVLNELGVGNLATRRVKDLSGGEQQRVSVARALSKQPKLILADEPASHLDRDNRLRVYQLLQQESSRGSTIIIAAHDPDLKDFCTTLVSLSKET